jgi:ATP-binding cassette subfamily B protein
VAQSAFVEVRQYLNYHPAAKWGALAAAAVSGLLVLLFLPLLGLGVDLLINQGNIPTYRRLTPQQQLHFLNQLQDPADQVVTRLEWLDRIDELGLAADSVVDPKQGLTLLDVATRPEQQLSTRSQELRRELLWRWQVYSYLDEHVGPEAARFFQTANSKMAGMVGTDLALDRDISRTGILSLVVRSQHLFSGQIAAWLAHVFPWTWMDGHMPYLLGLFIAAVILAVLRGVALFLNQFLAGMAVVTATTRLRRAVYHHTYRLGTLAFRALGPSEAVGVSTRHLEVISEGLNSWLTVYFREPIKFSLLFLFALLINVWLALAFLLFALLVWMLGGQFAAYFRRQGRKAGELAAEQLTLIQESLMLMRLVKVYLMESFNQSRVERQLSKFGRYQLRRIWGEAIYLPLLVFFGMLAALGLLLISGVVVDHGQLSVTGAIVLVTALVSLYLPLRSWLENRRILRRARDSSVVLLEFLKREGSVGQAVEAEFLPPLAQQLEFDNVSLREPGTGRRLLHNIALTIRAGQRVALVGPDDIEKYALVYLIPRFLDPASGEIRIDGRNLRWITLDSLRAQIAIVLQHNLVFNDTVANNIGCGDRSYTLPQIIDAAKLAHAHQFIQKLPKGYETNIGELGHALSVAEQYRIALARAILRDPALLIIEEPPVPLDDDVKDMLDDTMHRILPGRTVIFLPHRLSTIRSCDRVLLLYNGEIVASGDHKELINESELYRHLQYLEFNEFAGVVGPAIL